MMECIYGPMGFWSFTDTPAQPPAPDYNDPYDPYCVPLLPPRGFNELGSGVGANFFRSFQDDGGGGGGLRIHPVTGTAPPDPLDSHERKICEGNWYPGTTAQALPYKDAEVLKKPVIKKEIIAPTPAR